MASSIPGCRVARKACRPAGEASVAVTLLGRRFASASACSRRAAGGRGGGNGVAQPGIQAQRACSELCPAGATGLDGHCAAHFHQQLIKRLAVGSWAGVTTRGHGRRRRRALSRGCRLSHGRRAGLGHGGCAGRHKGRGAGGGGGGGGAGGPSQRVVEDHDCGPPPTHRQVSLQDLSIAPGGGQVDRCALRDRRPGPRPRRVMGCSRRTGWQARAHLRRRMRTVAGGRASTPTVRLWPPNAVGSEVRFRACAGHAARLVSSSSQPFH